MELSEVNEDLSGVTLCNRLLRTYLVRVVWGGPMPVNGVIYVTRLVWTFKRAERAYLRMVANEQAQ